MYEWKLGSRPWGMSARMVHGMDSSQGARICSCPRLHNGARFWQARFRHACMFSAPNGGEDVGAAMLD